MDILKHNVDEASRGNPSQVRGDGILCDYRGCIFAFSHFYGVRSNIVIKAMELLDGLLLCKACDLHNILLDLDSHMFVHKMHF